MRKTILEYKEYIENCKLDKLDLEFENILYRKNFDLLNQEQNLYWQISYEEIFFLYRDSDYYLFKLFGKRDNDIIEIFHLFKDYSKFYDVLSYRLILKRSKFKNDDIKLLFESGYYNEIVNIYNRFGICYDNLGFLFGAWFVLKKYSMVVDYCNSHIDLKREKHEKILKYYILSCSEIGFKDNRINLLINKYQIMFKKELF